MNQQCKVCGEPAAGFHFGAFTCEGCKSFFGRTYNNMSSISECKNNGDCVINKKNRTSCKSCRLRKCLLVGMSKSGSRYGRRSNWFKIHCLLQEQSSSGNPATTLNPNFISGNGTTLYPGLFNTRHILSTDKFLEARFNGYSTFPAITKHSTKTEIERCRTSSEGSAESSAGELEDESRSNSAFSRGPPSSHQTPSPFSEQEYTNNQKRIPTISSPSPLTCNVYNPSYAPPAFRPAFPIPRPGISPSTSLIFLDNLSPTPWPSRSGADVLLCSPASGSIAIDQDQPIDLSVKSINDQKPTVQCPEYSIKMRESPIQTFVENFKNPHIPLDLTNKRSQELSNPLS